MAAAAPLLLAVVAGLAVLLPAAHAETQPADKAALLAFKNAITQVSVRCPLECSMSSQKYCILTRGTA